MLNRILKYVIPSVLTSIFTGLFVIVDGFFVGHKVGDLGLAALNVAWPLTALLQTLGIAIGTSAGVYMSIYNGQKDEKMHRIVMSVALYLLLFFSIISLSILIFVNPLLKLFGGTKETIPLAYDYIKIIIFGSLIEVFGCGLVPIIRNLGYVKIASFSLVLATAFNFIGDYLFIYVFDLGLEGAALSSILGQLFACIISVILLIKIKKIYFKDFNIKTALKILKSSVAPFILIFSASILIIFNNRVSLKYGGNDGVAAYTILCYILYLAQYGAQGVSDGVQPIMSEYYGKKDKKSLMKCIKLSFIVMVVFLGTITIITLFMKTAFAKIFNATGNTYQIYSDGYYYIIAGFLFIGVIRLICCIHYATNKDFLANVLVVLEPFVITPLGLLIFPRIFKMNGVWYTYLSCQILLALISLGISYTTLKMVNREFTKME